VTHFAVALRPAGSPYLPFGLWIANLLSCCGVPLRPSCDLLASVKPCIPTLVSKPPEGPQWIHEIKHDGYRLIARKQDGRVRLFTRRGYDWTERYPLIAKALAALNGPPSAFCF
jgi:ATP-dependent DNA ligase